MFSSELDWAHHGLYTRRRGIVVGSLLMFAVAASFVSARTLIFSYWFVVAGFLLFAVFDRSAPRWQARPGPAALALATFFAFALISAAWAMRPEIALGKAVLGLALVASVVLVVPLILQETLANLLHMSEGVRIGVCVGLLYILVELLTDQSIKIWLFRLLELGPEDLNPPVFFTWQGATLIAIAPDDMTRNITSAALFLWPAAMLMNEARSKPWQSMSAVLVVLLTAAVVLLSQHESSKLALIVGLVAFAGALASLRWVRRAVAVGWILACLAVAPAALLAHRVGLQDAAWLQASARHRINIWNFTAEKMLEQPFVGIGANMTYVLGPEIEDEMPNFGSDPLQKTLSIHSHSIFMQTWLELGVVGAALLTLAGLSILGAMGTLAPVLQPYAYATFASAAAMAASSYGMWQGWFMAAFALCALLFAVGAAVLLPNSCPDAKPHSAG